MVTLVEPSNEAEPLRSPARLMARDVCSVVAVLALPMRGAVTAANVTDADVPTSWPMATDAVEPSPGVWVIVTPVPPATSTM